MNLTLFTSLGSLAIAVIAVITFYTTRLKTAKEQGRMDQQADDMKEKLASLEQKVDKHSTLIADNDAAHAGIDEKLSNLEKGNEEIKIMLRDIQSNFERRRERQ